MIEAKARGKVFTFEEGTDQEDMLLAIDSYFGNAPMAPQEDSIEYASPLSEERIQRERELLSPEGKPWYARPTGQDQSAAAVRDFMRYIGIGEGAETKTVEGVGSVTRLDELGFQMDMGDNVFSRGALYAEAVYPTAQEVYNPETLRTDYISAEDFYGKEVLDMPFEERLEWFKQDKTNNARAENQMTAAVLDEAGEDETMKMAGRSLTALLDPALIPAIALSGGAVIPMLAASGGYALSVEGTQQLLDYELDLDKLAQAAAIGTVFAGVTAPVRTAGLLYKGGVHLPAKGVEVGGKKLFNIVQNTRATKGSTASANSIVNKLEEKTAHHLLNTKLANGKAVTNAQAVVLAQKELGLSPKKMVDVFKYASRKPAYVSKANAIKIIAKKEQPLASTTALGKSWDRLASPISTALRNIDESISGSIRKMEMSHHISQAQSLKEVTPFVKAMIKASKSKDPLLKTQYVKLENALNDRRFKTANALMKKHFPEIVEPFKARTSALSKIFARAKDAGIKIPFIQNFNPRVVRDLEGLRAAAGTKQANAIDDALEAAAKKEGVGSWTELDDVTASEAISKAILFGGKRGQRKTLESGRVYETIPDHLRPFYYDTPTATQLYINKAEREIARHEFFGASGVKQLNGSLDLDSSVAKVILDVKKKRGLTLSQQDDLTMLLKARFDADNNAMSKSFATVRDLQYAALLGQFDSALIQLGDIGSSLYLNGIANTAKAMVTRGKGGLTAEDFGLINKVSAEMSNMDGVAKVLDAALTYSGFKRIDRFGKDTFLKAAWLKNTKLARENPQAIVNKYKNVFEDETADLVADLQAGRVTDNTKLMLWNELSDVQPISLSEMPMAYLNMKNGRILYSLKSFGLKQLDVVRKNIIQKAQSGHVAEAFEEALKYGMIMGITGGSVENARTFLRSGFDLDATASMDDAAFEALAKIFFMSKYSQSKFLQEGQYGSFAMNLLQPAAPSLIDTAGKAFDSVVFDADVDYDAFTKTLKAIPVFGSGYYYGLGGGAEKLIERVEDERAKEE